MFFWIIFLFLFIIFLFFDNIKNSTKNIIFYISCALLIFISGLRDFSIGNDTNAYVDIYNYFKNNSFTISRYELGYIYLNKCMHYFNLSVQSLFFLISFFVVYTISIFIKKNSKYILFGLFLFLGLRFFFSSFNILRQYIALSIFLYVITRYSSSRKNMIFAIFLASFFHYSSLVLLLLIPVYKIKISKNILFLAAIISTFFFIGFNTVFKFLITKAEVYEHYQNSDFVIRESYTASLMFTLISLFVLILLLKIKYLDKYKDRDSNLFVWMLIFSIFFNFLSIQASILDRMATYFNIVIVILLPNSIALINNKISRVFIKLIVVVLTVLYFVIILVFRPEWNNVYPYKINFL